MNPSIVYIEVSQNSLKALRENAGLEVPLERTANGRLTGPCREKLVQSLRNFIGKKGWQTRVRAVCAIGANGVSVRRVSLPVAAGEEFQRLLLLQVEKEFPLSPDELAWGYRTLGEHPNNGSPARQEILVAAVKKEVVEEYLAIFSACGLNPVFTLAALARTSLCPDESGTYAMLDISRRNSELMFVENGVAGAVRVLPWGADDFFGTGTALDSVAQNVGANWTGRKLYLTGGGELHQDLPAQLAARFANGVQCARLEVAAGAGCSAASVGLRKSAERNGGVPSLVFQIKAKPVEGKYGLAEPAPRKLAVIAGVLLAAWLLLPYAEAIVMKPFLTRKLAALKAERDRLPVIAQELEFLEFLKQNQPPYLDAVYLFAKSGPQGMKIDSILMNRRGEVSLRATMRTSDQVGEFRTKLINSGFFSAVNVDEQTPSPDRQKFSVRITAQWKEFKDRAGLSIGPTGEEIEKSKNTPRDPQGNSLPPGGAPSGGMPSGMPPGMPPGAMPRGMPPGMSIQFQ